ncbi:MAG: hypothetical protein JKY65_30355 [Planctomycetes bacterium]|nr:hypothetical protein [Planctomycetota bacterium]
MPGYWLREVWKEDKLLSNGPDPLAGARAWALHAGSAIRYARVSETVAALAFRDELVPWALGDSDPVRERVEARRREVVRTRTAD